VYREAVESCIYLYVRCLRVLHPHGPSPRWVYVLVGGCIVCLICLGIGFGITVACSSVCKLGVLNDHVTESCYTSYSLGGFFGILFH
jgi:hypothetical protein